MTDSELGLQLGVTLGGAWSKQKASCVATEKDIFQHPSKVAESSKEKWHPWTSTISAFHDGSLTVQVGQQLVNMVNRNSVCSNTLDEHAAIFAVDAPIIMFVLPI